MGINFVRTFDLITSELEKDRRLSESMHQLIDSCASDHPHADWGRLRSLPFDDLDLLLEWITRPLQSEPRMRPLRGLWFGIFNPIYDGKPSADFYISGTERFDPDPGDNGWAVQPAWWPKDRYAHSAIMASIYEIAYGENGLENDAEWPLCLGYTAFAIRKLLQNVDPHLILGTAEDVGIAAGFDSGDFILLGKLTRGGFLGPKSI